MNTPMQLLRRSQPCDDENFFGFLLRLSELNHFGSVNWLVQLAGLNTNGSNTLSKRMIFDTDVDLSKLSGLAGEPVESLEALRYPYAQSGKSVHFRGQRIPTQALVPLNPKICPECLSESNHARNVWDLKMLTCCPIHNCLLIDHCPGCGKPINWHRKGVSLCKCGFDFRTATPDAPSEMALYLTTITYRRLGYDVPRPSLSSPLDKLELGDLAQLMGFFSPYLPDRGADATEDNRLPVGANQKLHNDLTRIVPIFLDWPRNFIRFLKSTDFKPAKQAKYGLYHHFGSFYPCLKRLFANDNFTFIRDTFEKYLLKAFPEGYIRHKNLSIQDACEVDQYVSRAKAAELLNTSERWVDRHLDAGRLQGIIKRSGKKHLIRIQRSSVEALMDRYSDLMPMAAVKQLLRIKHKNVVALIDNDLLSCERGPSIDGYPTWQFSKANLQSLFAQIERHITPRNDISGAGKMMTFSDTRKMLSAYQFTTFEVFNFVVTGQLQACQRTDKFHIDRFLFDSRAIQRFIEATLLKLRTNEGYNMEQFAELIGVSLDAAYDIEKTGLIKARHVGMPKMGKIVSKEAAHQFNHTYIASTSIAKQIGVSSNTVIKCLTHTGIKPVAGPSVDGGPRYFYLRKDLADFDIKTIKPSRRAKKPSTWEQIPLFKKAA